MVGATHLDSPSTILALNGFAGRPLIFVKGQLATQPRVTYRVGSEWSQQSVIPKAWRTAVGIVPLRGERSTGTDELVPCTHQDRSIPRRGWSWDHRPGLGRTFPASGYHCSQTEPLGSSCQGNLNVQEAEPSRGVVLLHGDRITAQETHLKPNL